MRLLQRRIFFGMRFPADSNSDRRRSKSPRVLLATDAMTLIGHEVRPGIPAAWRPLVWFWCSVAAAATAVATILALLGPPPETAAHERAAAQLQADDEMQAKTALLGSNTPSRRLAEPPAPRVPSAPEASLPDPQPRAPAAPSVDLRAAGTATQQDAAARSPVLVLLHPARPEGSAAFAERLATRAGIDAAQVSVGSPSEAQTKTVIRFFSEADHALARRLGREVAGMGYSWKLENHSQRPGASKEQAIEVWLPSR